MDFIIISNLQITLPLTLTQTIIRSYHYKMIVKTKNYWFPQVVVIIEEIKRKVSQGEEDPKEKTTN